jgi:transcriptional regulator with XRE-family HTH domain
MVDEWSGGRMKALRKRARLTQKAAMEMSGVHYNTIVYLERGHHRPQNGTLQKLLNLYATRIRYWKQLDEELKPIVLGGGNHAQGTINPETPEWKRSSGLNHAQGLRTPPGSRPLSQPQGVPGVQGAGNGGVRPGNVVLSGAPRRLRD